MESDVFCNNKNPLDKWMTLVSLNEELICNEQFDTNMILGYVKANSPNSINRFPFFEHIAIKMLHYQDALKVLKLGLLDLYRLPFPLLKAVFNIIEKYEKEYKKVVDEKRKELEEQVDRIKQEFFKLSTKVQKKAKKS